MHLEWSAEFVPSPGGVADWELGQLDYVLGERRRAGGRAGPDVHWAGRQLTGGASAHPGLGGEQRAEPGSADRRHRRGARPPGHHRARAFHSPLAQTLLASSRRCRSARRPAGGAASPSAARHRHALAQMDVLSCGLDGLLTQLRAASPPTARRPRPAGRCPPRSSPCGPDSCASSDCAWSTASASSSTCADRSQPRAAGYMVSEPLTVTGRRSDRAAAAVQRAHPRLVPLHERRQPGQEADYQTSPVCGFLLPNHLDGSLEFFHPDGSAAGSLQPTRRPGQLAGRAGPADGRRQIRAPRSATLRRSWPAR